VPRHPAVEPPAEISGRTTKPSIRTVSFGATDFLGGKRLTQRDREHLATISTRLRVRAGTTLFHRGEPATGIYNIVEGAVASFRPLEGGERRITAFLFAEDLCGLARNGIYVNTAVALTAATVFRIPIDALKTMLLRNPELQLHFLCKVTHALRESQRHAVLLGCKDPVVRVARFLAMLESAHSEHKPGEISFPMTKRDIADYLSLTPAGIAQALADLESRRLIARTGPHGVRIADRRAFQALTGEP
jgi:CRP-like cAMP-binding protein